MKGLRARGGFEIEIEWKDREIIRAVITSLAGNPIPEIWEGRKIIDTESDRRIKLNLNYK